MISHKAHNTGTQVKSRLRAKATISGLTIIALAASTACASESAEDFPTDSIEFIVPFAAGGSTDLAMRQMANLAEETCGTNIVVSNQTGGAGSVGVTALSNANPDGYTVGGANSDLVVGHALGISDVGPDDIRGLMRYAMNPQVFLVPAESEYETIHDVVDAAENGETINVGTAGAGSNAHLAVEDFGLKIGIPGALTSVPFDGDGPSLQAVAGGEIDMALMLIGTGLPQVDAGNVRPIAVAGEERLESIPDVPTLTEEGIDMISVTTHGLAVPTETPDEIVDALHDCLHPTIQDESFVQAMDDLNIEIGHLPPAEFDAYMSETLEEFKEIVEQTGISE